MRRGRCEEGQAWGLRGRFRPLKRPRHVSEGRSAETQATPVTGSRPRT